MAGLELISYSTGEPIGNVEAGAVATLTGSVRLAVVSGGLLSLAGRRHRVVRAARAVALRQQGPAPRRRPGAH